MSSSQSPERVAPEQDVQGGFMFVPLTGKKDGAKNDDARKRVRAHVMHNFRDKESKAGQLKGDNKVARQSRKAPAPADAGQKMKFRLNDDGKLEESIPLRQRRKKTGLRRDQEEDVEGIAGGLRKRDAPPSPDLEAWTRQYFKDQSNLQPDLQPDFQLPSSLPAAGKEQYRTLTEGYFDHDPAPHKFWEETASVDYSLTTTNTALALAPLATAPLVAFGISRLDPFNVLPFQLTRRDEEYIERFQHWDATDSWCPVNGRGVWFAYAMQNEVVFHATMYHWGAHFRRTNNDFDVKNPEILHHKLTSFRMINEQLSQNSDTVADQILAAVAAIVNVEISFGSREEAKKHMKGLETMVDMKGGIANLKGIIDGTLQRFIGWNDLNYSELFGTQLRFAKDCTNHELPDSDPRQAPCFRQSILGIDYGPLVWERLQGDVINLLHEVRIICEEVSIRPFRKLREQERECRAQSMHKVERQFRFLTVVEQEDIVQSPSDRMWRTTALAGLMYVHHMVRFLPLEYRQFNSLSRDLQTAMALTGTSQGIWKNTPEILVWVLTTGTIISTGRMEHHWYVERLASACRDVGYSTWDRYCAKMRSFLWVERLDELRYKKVWSQVEMLL